MVTGFALCCAVVSLPQDMLTLTTRMNALARITLGNVNISATTALQVRVGSLGIELFFLL